MFEGINWGLLQAYFGQEQEVDFEHELYGQTYRRDIGETHNDPQSESVVDRALRLLAELVPVREGQRRGWLEDPVPTTTTSSTTTCKTTETKSCTGSVPPTAAVQGMQVRECDRRCTERSDRVHCVWPDPATGCVYGGYCALLSGDDERNSPCKHPPLQSSGVFHVRRAFAPRREYTPAGRRRPFPYASRSRWETPYRRGRQRRPAKTRTRKTISKT